MVEHLARVKENLTCMAENPIDMAELIRPVSTVRKKMAAVRFTTIPCEPNRVISTHRKPYFGEIHRCTNKIVHARFEVRFSDLFCVFL